MTKIAKPMWLVNQPRGIAVDILSYNTRIRWLRWELSTRAVRRIIKRRLSSPRGILSTYQMLIPKASFPNSTEILYELV
ncbi:hypothetical protein MRB53_009423 [Persea americana]|uniref:Uncharacterized protein n=1 Tax=Persea americana TaxID=3435 RepID=A0ACC2LNV6_PERAE|nr:hypothetical protein MRB53_009423 [Persea americana]